MPRPQAQPLCDTRSHGTGGPSHGQEVPQAWRGLQIPLLHILPAALPHPTGPAPHVRTHWAGGFPLPPRVGGPGPQLTPPSPTPSSDRPEGSRVTGFAQVLGSLPGKGWAPLVRCLGFSLPFPHTLPVPHERGLGRRPIFRKCCLVSNLKLSCCSVNGTCWRDHSPPPTLPCAPSPPTRTASLCF